VLLLRLGCGWYDVVVFRSLTEEASKLEPPKEGDKSGCWYFWLATKTLADQTSLNLKFKLEAKHMLGLVVTYCCISFDHVTLEF